MLTASAYVPQLGLSMRWEAVFLGGDLNGHTVVHTRRKDRVYSGHNVKARNAARERVLKFKVAPNKFVCNTVLC